MTSPRLAAALLPLMASLVLAAAVAGCGRKEAAPAPRPAAGENNLLDDHAPIAFRSTEGGFQTVFPSGCPRVRTRTGPTDRPQGPFDFVTCYCDRAGRQSEGVMVTAFFGLTDDNGGPPNPRTVVGKIREVLRPFNVEIMEQRMIRRGGLEGVGARCREVGGSGVVWIEGLLLLDKVYILCAWGQGEGLLTDPEIEAFFQGFQVLADTATE